MLVSFIGAKGCGKSTAAQHLIDHHEFVRVSMAGGLKTMLASIGLTEEQLYGDQKEVPCDLLCGQTPRHAMQTLGAEWGRKLIGEDIWVRTAQNLIASKLLSGQRVVCDDIRFPNEEQMFQIFAGTTIRVRRGAAEAVPDTHESEAFWRTLHADHEVENNGTLEFFLAEVEKILGL